MIRFAPFARHGPLAVLALVAWSAGTAHAVVVSATYEAPTALAPGDDPGWNNVGYLSSASGVYLGNRWVLTANHVADGPLRLSDGRVLPMVAGSSLQLANTGALSTLGSPDLKMFRLVDDPGLPSLDIGSTRPAAGATVVMIGAGHDRSTVLTGWRVTTGASGLVWSPAALPLANNIGYELLSTQTMRWGRNSVQSGTVYANGTTVGFATSFDWPGITFEAQAVSGDSGGGVFLFDEGAWKLVGIMDTQQLLGNQPPGTVVFGDQTQSADLATYRTQILNLFNRADPPWQNQRNYFDVDRSGAVSPLDALLIINELRAAGSHALAGKPSATDPLFDINGDGNINSTDALRVINALMGVRSTSASSGAMFVPEPSGAVLALLGVLAALAGRRIATAGRRRVDITSRPRPHRP